MVIVCWRTRMICSDSGSLLRSIILVVVMVIGAVSRAVVASKAVNVNDPLLF